MLALSTCPRICVMAVVSAAAALPVVAGTTVDARPAPVAAPYLRKALRCNSSIAAFSFVVVPPILRRGLPLHLLGIVLRDPRERVDREAKLPASKILRPFSRNSR